MAIARFNKTSLARMSQMLWHLTRGNAKSPNQIDYLVKMNLPPLLGRRNAIFSQAARLLKGDLFAIPDLERQTILNSCVNLLDEAINNTEAIIMTLSNADTAAREHPLHTFFVLVRDLVESAAKLTTFGDSLEKDNRAMIKFFGSDFNKSLNKSQTTFASCELHIVSIAQQMIKDAEKPIKRYWQYTIGSFNQHSAQRYQHAFDRTTAIYFTNALDKPTPPEGW